MSWEDKFRNYYDTQIESISVPPNTITPVETVKKEPPPLVYKLINSCCFALAVILIITAIACKPDETAMAKNINIWYQERGGKEFFKEFGHDFKEMLKDDPFNTGSSAYPSFKIVKKGIPGPSNKEDRSLAYLRKRNY